MYFLTVVQWIQNQRSLLGYLNGLVVLPWTRGSFGSFKFSHSSSRPDLHALTWLVAILRIPQENNNFLPFFPNLLINYHCKFLGFIFMMFNY